LVVQFAVLVVIVDLENMLDFFHCLRIVFELELELRFQRCVLEIRLDQFTPVQPKLL
jgi:hypothetical protein